MRPPPRPRSQGALQELTPRSPGAPSWITAELVAETLRVWQPYYRERLTEVEAIEILLNAAHLLGALAK